MATRVDRIDEPLTRIPERLARALELFPAPSVHLVLEAAGASIIAFNSAYAQTTLGTDAATSPMVEALIDRITLFLSGAQLREEFDWQAGETVDCRYYRVGFARTSPALTDRCTITLIDQTSQRQTERSLRREMTTDSLTGLLNHQGFADLIDARRAEGDEHAVLVVNLERFGRVNSCLGSVAGNELLLTIARRLRGALRARDTLARIDSSAFGILAAVDRATNEADRLAERIHGAMNSPFRLSTYEIGVECSVGIDKIDADGDDMIRNAKFAARRTTAAERTQTYQTETLTAARACFAMETALRRAIEMRELRLVFQPVRRLASGAIGGFEALARWRDRDGREYSPAEFIPVAEESGLIIPLGRWVAEEAAATLERWERALHRSTDIRMAFNVSAIQLQRDNIPALVTQVVADKSFGADRLMLELTESAVVSDPEGVSGTLRELKRLGTRIALDDFGTGYSNLAYLQQLPIDVLKIDRSLVTDMTDDSDKLAIVNAIVSLSKALNMRVTAEGIETPDVAEALRVMGCTSGQGYLYARPLEFDDAFALMAASTSSAI